jgi:RimJ/RimL family protein N-acetyltransferase
MRPADASDIRTLFDWRNDPWIVSVSTTGRAVTWEEHQAWFPSVLDRSRHLLFIIHTDEGIPAGSLRLDRKGADAVVSIYLMKPYTGIGLGPRAIKAGCQKAFEHWPVLERIVAYVRSDNRPSVNAFSRAMFHHSPEEATSPPGHVALVRMRGDS